MFDFRIAKVFCLGHRLSKHKMTGYLKNLVGIMAPWATPLSRPLFTYEKAQSIANCTKAYDRRAKLSYHFVL